MMGTEGRRPGQEIAPSSEPYDLVVFRSADIEDLQIFEPPTAPPAPKPFVDPAIVSVGGAHGAPADRQTNDFGGHSGAGWPTAPRLQFGTATPVESVAPRAVPTHFGSLGVSRAPVRAPTFGSVQGVNGAAPPGHSQGTRTPPSAPAAPPARSTDQYARPAFSAPRANGAENAERVMAYNTGTGKIELVERHSRSYASVVSDGAGRFRLSADATSRLVPRHDYDFQQANSKLRKEQLPAAAKETFYDRTSSFFDNISCESTGSKDGKHDRNERRWNIETFGTAGPSFSSPSYGGGGASGGSSSHHGRAGYYSGGRGGSGSGSGSGGRHQERY